MSAGSREPYETVAGGPGRPHGSSGGVAAVGTGPLTHEGCGAAPRSGADMQGIASGATTPGSITISFSLSLIFAQILDLEARPYTDLATAYSSRQPDRLRRVAEQHAQAFTAVGSRTSMDTITFIGLLSYASEGWSEQQTQACSAMGVV